jgi:hypothetical protein
MTKDEALRFKEKWAAVNQVTIEEERRKSPEERLRDLAILYRAGKLLGWPQRTSDDEDLIRARWQKLREVLGAKKSDG